MTRGTMYGVNFAEELKTTPTPDPAPKRSKGQTVLLVTSAYVLFVVSGFAIVFGLICTWNGVAPAHLSDYFKGVEPAYYGIESANDLIESREAEAGVSISLVKEGTTACGPEATGCFVGAEWPMTGFIEVSAQPAVLDPRNYALLDVVISHELSHSDIFDLCKAVNPPIAGDRYEYVTNAYAVLAYNADETLVRNNLSYGSYTAADMDAARALLNGSCV